jgi:hypothetical protein
VVVLAGADADQTGGVVVAANEAFLVDPRGIGAAGTAVRILPAYVDLLCCGVDGDLLGALVVTVQVT